MEIQIFVDEKQVIKFAWPYIDTLLHIVYAKNGSLQKSPDFGQYLSTYTSIFTDFITYART